MRQSESGCETEGHSDLFDYLDIGPIVAVNKYDRQIRRLHVLSKEEEDYSDRCKYLLSLDKEQIIERYDETYQFLKDIQPERNKKIGKTEEQEYFEDQAYELSAIVIKEKLKLQIDQWHQDKEKMLFVTLTLDDEKLNAPKEWLNNEIRRWCARTREKKGRDGLPCRYCVVFEFGSKKGRPHFHVLCNAPVDRDWETNV